MQKVLAHGSEGSRSERHARAGLPAAAALRRRGGVVPGRARVRAVQRERGLQPGRGAQPRRTSGAEAEEAMVRFQKLRDSPYKTALSSNYLEQGRYAEAVASTGAEPEAVDQSDALGLVRGEAGCVRSARAAAGPAAGACHAGAGRPRRRWPARRARRRAVAAAAEGRRLGLRRRDRGLRAGGHDRARRARGRLRQRRRPRPAAGPLHGPVAAPERGLLAGSRT